MFFSRLFYSLTAFLCFKKKVNVFGSFKVQGAKLIKIGSNLTINHGVSFTIRESLTIGDHVILSEGVAIFDCGLDPNSINGNHKPTYSTSPIVISDHVWVGARSIILPGVQIGSCAVIGAGSVVTKSVPSFSVVCGNPARVIRQRNKYINTHSQDS